MFQEIDGPFDIAWKCSHEASCHARQFLFHPSQTVEELKDGGIIVSFQACGLKEMVWHLLTWDEHVEIISPPELQEAYQGLVNRVSQRKVKKIVKATRSTKKPR